MAIEHNAGRSVRVVAAGALALALAGCAAKSGSGSTLAVPAGSHPASAGSAGSAAAPGAGDASSPPASPSAAASSAQPSAAGGGAPAAGGGYTSAALPASVWITPAAIPLDPAYHWQAPAAVDKQVKSPVLTAVQDCQLNLGADAKAELGAFPAAQADVSPTSGGTGGQDDWSAQETVLATGDTSSGDIQGIYSLYTDLVAAIKQCSNTAPGASVTDVVSSGSNFSATVTIPTSTGTTLTVHEYLSAPYGFLVELSVWVAPYAGDKASAAWDGTQANNTITQTSLVQGPCAVTKLC